MVTVYSKPDCQGCRMTKLYLGANDVAYQELDVTLDVSAREHVESLGITMLPVVDAGDGTWWHGFRPDSLKGLIAS